MMIAPITKQYHRNGAPCGGGTDRQVDKDRPRATMAADDLVEPACSEPVIGEGAVELKAGVPMAQLMSWTKDVTPEALDPHRLG